MKETLLQALYIMRIVLVVAVVVSVGAFLFDTEPPEKDKPLLLNIGGGGEYTKIVIQETEEIEKTDDVVVKQSEDSEAVPPFDFDVNVITKRNVLLQNVHYVHQIIPNNSMAWALEELEKRKGYFICLCKRCFRCRRNKTISTTPSFGVVLFK